MGKMLYPALVVLFVALNVAAYAYLAFELNGSTLKTKQSIMQPERQQR